MVAAQGAAWVAVCVESSRRLAADSRRRLDQNLSLARELGAEVVITHDEDVATALVRVALQYNATQIVVGKSRTSRLFDLLRGGSLVDRLLRLSGSIDIYVVPSDRAAGGTSRRIEWEPPGATPAGEYVEVAVTLALLTAGGWVLRQSLGYLSIGLLYLLAVIVLSLRVGRWPVMLAGVLSALTWNFVFIPPQFTFVIEKFEDGMMFATYFVVALVAGHLTARIRAQERHERWREERATALLRLTQALGTARSLDDAVFAALRQADALFGAHLGAASQQRQAMRRRCLTSPVRSRSRTRRAAWPTGPGETARRPADSPTRCRRPRDFTSRSCARIGRSACWSCGFRRTAMITLAQRDLAESFAAQLALVVETEELRAAGEREKLLAESDKLHRALLDGVSHELKTPLAVLTTAVENLREADAMRPAAGSFRKSRPPPVG
jgi:two-component system sensor histidine kinase KdpD